MKERSLRFSAACLLIAGTYGIVRAQEPDTAGDFPSAGYLVNVLPGIENACPGHEPFPRETSFSFADPVTVYDGPARYTAPSRLIPAGTRFTLRNGAHRCGDGLTFAPVAYDDSVGNSIIGWIAVDGADGFPELLQIHWYPTKADLRQTRE